MNSHLGDLESQNVLKLWDKVGKIKHCPTWALFKPLERSWSLNIKSKGAFLLDI
jgi:hypothetical protein